MFEVFNEINIWLKNSHLMRVPWTEELSISKGFCKGEISKYSAHMYTYRPDFLRNL